MKTPQFRKLLAIGTLLLGFAIPAFSIDVIQDQFAKEYNLRSNPNRKMFIDNCATCHQPAVAGTLNAYGHALLIHQLNFKAIEGFDSDKDGLSNLEEIIKDTSPGSQSTNDGTFNYYGPSEFIASVAFKHKNHIALGFACNACHTPEKFGKWFRDEDEYNRDRAHTYCTECHKTVGAPVYSDDLSIPAAKRCAGCHTGPIVNPLLNP